MALQRPAWTICFVLIWITVIPATLLTHISISKLIPVIEDLPDNLVKGFDEVFKFAYLEADAKQVKASSATAISKCKLGVGAGIALDASQKCPKEAYKNDLTALAQKNEKMDPKPAKTAIQNAFQTSLEVIQKVANDKYLGTKDFQNTAAEINKMNAEFNKIPDKMMECAAALPVFCEIYNAGDELVKGMSEVTKAINEFKTSDEVKQFKDNVSWLNIMHALPWFMVFAILMFTIFWAAGGVCCCCEGGTPAGCLMFFFAIFWLASVILYSIIMGTGYFLKYHQADIAVDALNGKPNLEEAIAHIQTTYPAFWKIVFEPMEEPLNLIFNSSLIFNVLALVIFFYSCCECIITPYKKTKDAENTAAVPVVAAAPAAQPVGNNATEGV